MALAAHALTTYAKASARLAGAMAGDQTLIEDLINEASGSIARRVGRQLHRASVVEKLRPNGLPRLILRETPLVSITSIVLDGETIGATTYAIEDADLGFVHLDEPPSCNDLLLYGSIAQDMVPGSGKRSLVVTYVAGYVAPGQASAGPPAVVRDLPEEIEEACIICVAQAWRLFKSGYAKSEVPFIGGGAGIWGDIPDVARCKLEPYCRGI
jgi:hypothetical protein